MNHSFSFLSRLAEHKILLVTGKGGTGKTLIASSIAASIAEMGKKVCLVESNSIGQIAPLFKKPEKIHELLRLGPNIYSINLESRRNFKDFVVKHLGFEKIFEKIFNNEIVSGFVDFLPAVSELTLLGRLFYMAELNKTPQFDLVIFDGYSSGHFIKLLETPCAIAGSPLVGPIVDETQKIIDYFSEAKKCVSLVVGGSDELVIRESIELISTLESQPLAKVDTFFLNRCLVPWDTLSEKKMMKEYLSIEAVTPKGLVELEWANRLYQEKQARQELKTSPSMQNSELHCLLESPHSDDLLFTSICNSMKALN